jgi:hypothetical protein
MNIYSICIVTQPPYYQEEGLRSPSKGNFYIWRQVDDSQAAANTSDDFQQATIGLLNVSFYAFHYQEFNGLLLLWPVLYL